MHRDAFSYLEDSQDERTLTWVSSQNQRTLDELKSDPRYRDYVTTAVMVDRLSDSDAGHVASATFVLSGTHVYENWIGPEHPKGLWRRSTLKSFLGKAPSWEKLLDMDALDNAEGRNWSLAQMRFSPSGKRCLMKLSDGGTYSYQWREFDLVNRNFVEGGFNVPDSYNSRVAWRSDEVVLLSADFGPGTTNGAKMPIVIKEWARGSDLATAKEIFRGETSDIAVTLDDVDAGAGEEAGEKQWLIKIFRWTQDGRNVFWMFDRAGHLKRMTLPRKCWPKLYRNNFIVKIEEDWSIGGKTWKAGSILAIPVAQIAAADPAVLEVMQPSPNSNLVWWENTRDGILIFEIVNANYRIWISRPTRDGWKRKLVHMPDFGTISALTSSIHSDIAFVGFQSFLAPVGIYAIRGSSGEASVYRTNPRQFDDSRFIVQQYEATSADGVAVPYFLVRPKTLNLDASAPTILTGYGSSGGAQTPSYSGVLGKLWLEKGGTYVLANVRGGTEKGLDWWVTKTARQRTYDDMVAVAEDLIQRRVTSPRHLGIVGTSDGGLLAGVTLTKRPDLFGAAVLKVAVLDQLRMDLLAGGEQYGATEYGSPSVREEREFLERTSPFQNVRKSSELPDPLVMTCTTDPAVLPAQSRRFAAKLESLGLPFLFYESPEGGHAMASTFEQRGTIHAIEYLYLARRLFGTSHSEQPVRAKETVSNPTSVN